MAANVFRVSFVGDENVLKLDCADGCPALSIYSKPLSCTLSMGEWSLRFCRALPSQRMKGVGLG